jgi:hypothetical protein
MRQGLGVLAAAIEADFSVFRCFVGLIDPGEILDLAGERACRDLWDRLAGGFRAAPKSS